MAFFIATVYLISDTVLGLLQHYILINPSENVVVGLKADSKYKGFDFNKSMTEDASVTPCPEKGNKIEDVFKNVLNIDAIETLENEDSIRDIINHTLSLKSGRRAAAQWIVEPPYVRESVLISNEAESKVTINLGNIDNFERLAKKLLSVNRSEPAKFVFIDGSNTNGRARISFVKQFEMALNNVFPVQQRSEQNKALVKHNVVNLGRGGATSEFFATGFRQSVEHQLDDADMVIFEFCVNDGVLGGYPRQVAGYESLLLRVRNKVPRAKIVDLCLTSPNKAHESAISAHRPFIGRIEFGKFREMIQTAESKSNPVLFKGGELLWDRIHYGVLGCAFIRAALISFICQGIHHFKQYPGLDLLEGRLEPPVSFFDFIEPTYIVRNLETFALKSDIVEQGLIPCKNSLNNSNLPLISEKLSSDCAESILNVIEPVKTNTDISNSNPSLVCSTCSKGTINIGSGWARCKSPWAKVCKPMGLLYDHCSTGKETESAGETWTGALKLQQDVSFSFDRMRSSKGIQLHLDYIKSYENFGEAIAVGWLSIDRDESPSADGIAVAYIDGLWNVTASVTQGITFSRSFAPPTCIHVKERCKMFLNLIVIPLNLSKRKQKLCKIQLKGISIML